MSEPKHTPGPWECHSGGEIKSSTGQTLAICAYGTGIPLDEYHANARLIAFAPDLWAALKEMVAEASHLDDETDLWAALEEMVAEASHLDDETERGVDALKRACDVLAWSIGEDPNQASERTEP